MWILKKNINFEKKINEKNVNFEKKNVNFEKVWILKKCGFWKNVIFEKYEFWKSKFTIWKIHSQMKMGKNFNAKIQMRLFYDLQTYFGYCKVC